MPTRQQNRASALAKLLDQAMTLVSEEGVAALSIEALGRATRVSRVQLRQQFASDDALLEAVLEHSCARFDRAIEETAQGLQGPGAWLRAYVMASLWEFTRTDAAAVGLFAILPPGDPRNVTYARFARRWRERAVGDGVETGTALAVKFAADAIWFERAYGTISDEDVALVRKRLLRLVEEETARGG